MILLMLFALVAGAGTALTPCVLPVLPVVLSAGATGGRRRPLGIVTGLALSFTFATVALVYVIDALGLADDLVRKLAIAVLLVFGFSLLVPAASARVEAYLSRFTRGPRSAGGDGFNSGLVVGASLGFVYAPCAGPILAGVITVSASQTFTLGKLLVALSYGIGSAAVLYAIALGGRRVTARLRPHVGHIQEAMGAVMVVVALVMYLNLDTRFETALAKHVPDALVNPTKPIEDTASVRRRLADVRGGGRVREAAGEAEAVSGSRLPVLGPAPPFRDTQRWFNTPGERPLTLSGLRGRVVLIDFWTYSCINCLRTLPYVTAWDRRYRKDGLTVVGVHTPEFPFEKVAANVQGAIADNGIHYPVVQDNDYGTWTAYGNQFWPAKYLIDAEGRIRYVHFGEGKYGTTERAIRSLLAEAGQRRLGADARARAQRPSPGVTTPETYLGAARAERFLNGPVVVGTTTYRPLRVGLPPDHLAYGGTWRITPESATAGPGASVALNFGARRVFLVVGSPGRARTMRVLLDGHSIPDRFAGSDVRGGTARIESQRLYRLVDLPKVGRHDLKLKLAPGISGYALTFG
jgi:cytochrome c biogenesis protein CcdA/thiol-disulfide isomerase/thioredoxin